MGMDIMQQAKAMQSKMEEMQAKMEKETVEGASGGGLVTVKTTCKGEAISVKIDESLLSPSEQEVLGDLIVSAFNNARKNSDAKMELEMKKIAESLGLPSGMMKFPF
jgi:DNA-binding YbaB/EbfC family protein